MATTVPVPFADLGKASNDLLGKDYPVGQTKFELKTVAPNGVTFNVLGNQDNKSGAIAGELKTKYVDYKNGLTVTESWTTGNLLTTQIELENKVAKGLKLDITGGFLPSEGKKNAKVGVQYKQLGFNSRAYVDLFKGPTFTGDVVVGRDGFLLGGDVAYDVSRGTVSRFAAAAGYTAPEYSVALHANNSFKVFSASYYHRINADLEAGGKAVWDSKAAPAGEGKAAKSPVALEVGAKLYLDRDAFVKAKVNNAGVLGLGYTQALRKGVKVSIAGLFDTTKLNQPAHKLGLSFVFEA
ncbi:Mitochondrial porin [Actinomortierella ambigua]|uniref:Mitochondrial porin n=1 Tax=Actinomortierella ambigua TaxID=1343610 RepID=A0A9P6QHV1_9FUNG|nr:Mitochondrial porin [Actinomortierella ambigua]KAG0265860.1 Mitochondrial porin [Actinomortierella ambigua]